ncbi:hypothetical protein C7E18_23170, partial [Stenotrophomonas maltophilia]
ASLQPAPLWLRANRQHGGRDKALAALAEAGIAANPARSAPMHCAWQPPLRCQPATGTVVAACQPPARWP